MNIKRELAKINIKTDYRKSDLQCCLDPFRKKLIPATKEEIVRQKVAVYFRDVIKAPEYLIFTEDALSHWGSNSKDRADIIIAYEDDNQNTRCLGIIECKSPDIPMSSQTYDQCRRYIDELGGKYIFITNGIEIYAWHTDGKITEELSVLPDYQEMLNENLKIQVYEPENCLRCSFNELNAMSEEELYDTNFIGDDTPKHLWKHIVNLGDCIFDTEHNALKKQFNGFEIIEDLGISWLNYGDASGSDFGTGIYRSLLIKDQSGNNQVISFSIMPVGKTENDPKYGNLTGKSSLVVSFRDFKVDYTVVQINLNTCLKLESNKLTLWHNGAVMKKGARKEELIRRVKSVSPSMIRNGKIYLGTLPSDKLMYLDSNEVMDTLCNLILYSLIRNEYKLDLRASDAKDNKNFK